MVALVFSVIATLVLSAVIPLYARRRPVGTPLTWGEAMVAAAYVFLLMFLIYGIVPHQWLTYAGNELGWRKDKIMLGWGEFLGKALPFTITYEAIMDIIATVIYGIGIGGQIALWMLWQNRGKERPKELPTSAYGRPLVKPGAGAGA